MMRMNRDAIALVGAVANLIVAETARHHGINLTFGEFFKTGRLITLASLPLGVLWLQITG